MVASAHFQAEIFLVSAWPYRRFDSARHSCLFVTAGVACMICIYIYIYRVHYIYHIYMLRAGVGCMIYIYLIIIITIISEMTDIYLLFLIFQIVLVKIVFIISTADYIVSHFLSSSVQWAKQKKLIEKDCRCFWTRRCSCKIRQALCIVVVVRWQQRFIF